mgnify:CR=1 FL=1
MNQPNNQSTRRQQEQASPWNPAHPSLVNQRVHPIAIYHIVGVGARRSSLGFRLEARTDGARERAKRPLGPAGIMRNKNFNDWAVALIVIACSIMLFLALAFALSGKVLGAPSRPLRVNFHDVTGVTLGSQVKFAGAIAGKVASIRMLTPEERTKSGDPLNAVQLLLAINLGCRRFHQMSALASRLTPCSATSSSSFREGLPRQRLWRQTRCFKVFRQPPLTSSLAKWTVRSSLRGMLSGTKGEAGDIFDQVRRLLSEAQGLSQLLTRWCRTRNRFSPKQGLPCRMRRRSLRTLGN